ncbi:site-2 protease family protein [Corynebacterium uropygiale]|uniref:Zinc metalloprotease Rip1 n=1 Tax=Corynebacterium uropygiale TaxID=1775911 RepID=A0A9X1U753_9CORY|nr:site-2 protease family protein [Corynebacterium uropygiale]
MGAYILGVLLFALGIAVTIALHEWGHLTAARACGMRVRRYFIGFGPRVWSFRRGTTEYGLKAVPLGGFCEIAGMTAQDEVTAEEAPHAMVNKPWWQRIIVLLGGVIMNVLIGFIIIYGVGLSNGLPNPDADPAPVALETVCAADQLPDGSLARCSGEGPAAAAGIQPGDRVRVVEGQQITSFGQVRDIVMAHPGERVSVEVERNGQPLTLHIDVQSVQRLDADGTLREVGAIGLTGGTGPDAVKKYGPIEGIGPALRFSGQFFDATVKGLLSLPGKVPGVVASIFGAERAVDSPMSVVGASRVGGEMAERSMWTMFWMMLANLNFFLALFNLVPLPPLDGGHIAVVLWEKLRDGVRRMRGLPALGPADYTRLMPLTMTIAALLVSLGVVVIVADVVNPVRLFG